MIHVLYENDDWLPPLVAALEAEGLEHHLWRVQHGHFDPLAPPPRGIYLNRMSPSSHTRGHDESVDLTLEMLAWLEHHGRRVVNGSRAVALEVSKARQALALRRHGIRTPETRLAVGRAAALEAAATLPTPFITKHNQGGKGLGIVLLESVAHLAAAWDDGTVAPGPKGQMLLQDYIQPREGFITRVEIVADRFLYAMRSDTSDGFELCPADACEVPATAPEVCPAEGRREKFTLSPLTADDPLVGQYRALCAAEGIELAGIEFVEGADGTRYTYDINTTTNYNPEVGRAAGVNGMRETARHLRRLVGEATSA
ncbi:MAG: alpha-L-glutamate ligase [Myxococcota bacterium]